VEKKSFPIINTYGGLGDIIKQKVLQKAH